jgi:putative addiction module component (TIGR02574 family)
MITESIDNKINSILELKLEERIYAYQLIWQSILDDIQKGSNLLSDEQISEIDRRLEKMERDESELFSWQEVKQEIKASL